MIHPVILSGGAGSRLWPLSTPAHPKQFHALAGPRTLIQDTALRFDTGFEAPRIIANQAHGALVTHQMDQIGTPPARLMLEPCARNTAPAIAAAALDLARQAGPEALMLVLPADHVIAKPDVFLSAIDCAAPAARNGHLVTFGIVPDHPHTGYGYIKKAAPLDERVFVIDAFVEKPDAETARAYLDSGDYWWNSGMFVWRADAVLAELEAHEPAIVSAARQALDQATETPEGLLLDEAAFSSAPAISIDYAVMEPTRKGAVVPLEGAGWSDIGAWDAVQALAPRDSAGNASLSGARTAFVDATGSLVSTTKPVALVGVADLVVIETGDAILVVHRDHAQKVKDAAGALKD